MAKFLFILLALLPHFLIAQSNIDINGYLQNMQTVWAPKNNLPWILSNSISNRLNFTWYASEDIKTDVSLRNIFDYGEFVSLISYYSDFVTKDLGYLDLTEKITSGNSHIFYSNIDRLSFTYSGEDFEIQVGRQRINWGINMVWTPNDIFNSASFINFDYVEKPGSDAIRFQYYLDFASSIEVVGKLDHKKDLTLAGKLQLNQWDYDFQLLGGITDQDYILGGGWSGSLFDAGFSGEFTLFKDKNKNQYYDNIFVSSLGINYTFSNSLFISSEFLFNSIGKTGKSITLRNIFDLDYSAKNLSPAKYSIFGQASYPITPLINASLATIINPSDGSFFLNPTTEISINEDVYLLISGQIFIGDNLTEWGDYGKFYYLRIKWNF